MTQGKVSRVCSVEGCEQDAFCRGWCHYHYDQWRYWGHPLGKMARPTDEERFTGRVDRVGPIPPHRPELGHCWLWLGSLTWGGYGNFYFRGSPTSAHRASYEMFIGPIPAGLHIDHLCRNRACVNPAHLEPVTPQENAQRGAWGMRTHCSNGHKLTSENVYLKNGKRTCLKCRRHYGRTYMRRKRAEQRRD